jgi:hypothetical protein
MKKQISPFTTENSHSQKVIDKLNFIWKKNPDAWWILSEMQLYFDNCELDCFAEHLQSRLPKEYVIEYNVRSLCGTKAYSAVVLDVEKEFSQKTFNDMISYARHKTKDGSIYYLEQDLEGRRGDGGQGILYDRVWVRSPMEGKDFLRYIEKNL